MYTVKQGGEVKKNISRVMVSGTHGGLEKTLVTTLILSSITESVPFKLGPDNAISGFYQTITGKKTTNLDSWMQENNVLKYLFDKYSDSRSISVIEGSMGFYDSFDIISETGSSSNIAKLLKTPVILVINARKISTSLSAVILGFKQYDPEVNISGIILCNITSPNKYLLVKKMIEEKTEIPCIGYVPLIENQDIRLKYYDISDIRNLKKFIEYLNYIKEITSITINYDLIKQIAENAPALDIPELNYLPINKCSKKIAVAHDLAFNMYYSENLKLLEEHGGELHYFSPLRDKKLPDDVDIIYIGNGLFDKYVHELSENHEMLSAIKGAADKGKKIYAEGAGLNYLSRSFKSSELKEYKMASVLPVKIKKHSKPLRFGYVSVNINGMKKFNSYEYNYHTIEGARDKDFIYQISKNNEVKWKCGIKNGNIMATYQHFHFYSNYEYFKEIFDF